MPTSDTTNLPVKAQFIAVCIIFLFGLIACSKDKEPETTREVVRPAKIITVGESANSIRTFPAVVKATERSELAFRVSGELKQLPVKAGEMVKRGQLLAQLDQTDFKLRLDDRKAKHELSKAQYERADKLVKDRLIPVSDYDKAKSSFLAAKADLELAKKDMDYTSLRAPFDGRISHVLVKNFENVQAKQPVMVVQTVDAIDLEFYVPEHLLTKVKDKPPEERKGVEVKFDQFPEKTFRAFMTEYDSEADPKTQAFRIIVTMKAPKGMRILPGMTAIIIVDMAIVMGEDANKIIVPVEAVFSAENQPIESEERFVWKYEPESQQVSKTAVKVGELTTNGIVVTEGLLPGDQVVAAGVHFLEEGQKIRPIVRERGL